MLKLCGCVIKGKRKKGKGYIYVPTPDSWDSYWGLVLVIWKEELMLVFLLLISYNF